MNLSWSLTTYRSGNVFFTYIHTYIHTDRQTDTQLLRVHYCTRHPISDTYNRMCCAEEEMNKYKPKLDANPFPKTILT